MIGNRNYPTNAYLMLETVPLEWILLNITFAIQISVEREFIFAI